MGTINPPPNSNMKKDKTVKLNRKCTKYTSNLACTCGNCEFTPKPWSETMTNEQLAIADEAMNGKKLMPPNTKKCDKQACLENPKGHHFPGFGACVCPCHTPSPENYERISHNHCFNQENPPCGKKAHAQCCLCDLKPEGHITRPWKTHSPVHPTTEKEKCRHECKTSNCSRYCFDNDGMCQEHLPSTVDEQEGWNMELLAWFGQLRDFMNTRISQEVTSLRESDRKRIEEALKQYGVNTPFVGAPVLNREQFINLITNLE